jgi:hypothetical protein
MITVGMLVGVWDGTHLARVVIDKLNRKTFSGHEDERSHTPGRRWCVSYDAPYALFETLLDGRIVTKWQNSL